MSSMFRYAITGVNANGYGEQYAKELMFYGRHDIAVGKGSDDAKVVGKYVEDALHTVVQLVARFYSYDRATSEHAYNANVKLTSIQECHEEGSKPGDGHAIGHIYWRNRGGKQKERMTFCVTWRAKS